MKFTVTEVLVSYIKEKRKEKNLTVTAFAERIGKSKSYITKFDNCEFKTLTVEAFNEIFEAISDTKEQANELMDEYFLSLIRNNYIDKNIDLLIDFTNYSHIIKEIEIPNDLIIYLNEILIISNLDIQKLVDTANQNAPVNHYSNFNLLDFNEYSTIPVSIDNTDNNTRIYIKIRLEEEYILSILNKKITKCNYFTLLAFANAYYQIKFLESDSDSDTNNEDLNRIASISAHDLLFNFKFYNLGDFDLAKESVDNLSELISSLEKSSNSVQRVLGNYMSLITHIYEQNLYYTERKILGLEKNLEEDPAFLVGTMDLPFYKVKKLNIDNKKKLMREIAELIDKYTEADDDKEQINLI